MLRGFFLRKISNSSCHFAASLISLLDRVCKMFFALEQEDRNSVSAFLATNDFRMSENFSKSYFSKLNDQWHKWTFLFREILLLTLSRVKGIGKFIFFPFRLFIFHLFVIVCIHLFKSQIRKIFRLKNNIWMMRYNRTIWNYTKEQFLKSVSNIFNIFLVILLKIEQNFSNKTTVFATSNYTKLSAIEIKCQWLFQEESHETFARSFTV